MAEIEIIQIGKWSVALERRSGGTMLRFDFADAQPLVLLVPKTEASQIAEAILNQYKTPPPSRLS
jgi:hypothetical protein